MCTVVSKDYETSSLIDRFIPEADVRKRHETIGRAPAAVVLEVARHGLPSGKE